MGSTEIPSISIFIACVLLAGIQLVSSIPFVVFHGLNDSCEANSQFVADLSRWSGSPGSCLEIGDGVSDSWTIPLLNQSDIGCEKVKKMSELSNGYNIVGLSQGSLVGRGIVELCDGGPPVKNLVSLGGAHAGIASVPMCRSGDVCIIVNALHKLEIYSNYVQEHLAPSGLVKIPTDIDGYMKGGRYLPKLNNEIKSLRNSTYKERLTRLENLVLIMFAQDSILVPKETSLFGYYPDGDFDTILPYNETRLYIEDWIGLRTLDEAGKVKFVTVSGDHLEISKRDMRKYIVPYLRHKQLRKAVS